jgi:hypothetical protein
MNYFTLLSPRKFSGRSVRAVIDLLARISILTISIASIHIAWAAQPNDSATRPKSQPDVLTFTNGDKLTGKFERSAGDSLTFKSDMAGEITVNWSKIKEFHTFGQYAVIPKNVTVKRGEDLGAIPRGRVAVQDQKIEVSEGQDSAPRTVAIDDSAYIVDENTFNGALIRAPGFFRGWAGAITGGASLVDATQKSTSFNGAVGLARTAPDETWLQPSDRTSFNFSFAYGKLTQPATADVKTDIYHLDTERDEYFSPKLYGFGQLAYDHNFSQGLDLQQSYGAGIGWTAIKNSIEQFDLKASLNYVKQQFQMELLPAAPIENQNQNLVGSIFTEIYGRTLPRKILFNEQLSINPAWNNTNAYSASASAGFVMPVYKRLSISVNSIDSFLNNPSPGFRKNSFQFTTGITYSLR